MKVLAVSEAYKKASVLKEILSFDQDTIKSRVLFDISYDFYSKKDSSNFRFWNKASMDHSLNIKDTLRIAEANWDLANFFYKEKLLDSSYYYYNIALELYEKKDNDYQAGRMLINLATIQRDIKDYQNSEISTIRALRKIKPLGKKYQLYLVYNNLGITNNQLEAYKEALKFHEKALEIANELENQSLRALSLNNIGVVFRNVEQHSKAIESYKTALEMDDWEEIYPELQAMLVDNLAYSRFMIHDTVDVEKDFLRALALREEIDHYAGIATSYLHLGDYYLKATDSLKARAHYLKSRSISMEKKLNEELLQSTLALAKLGGAKSQDFYNEYIEKSTEFLREERAVKNRFAKIRFQTDELIAETKRLTEQRIWLTVVSILVIMFLLLLYYLRVQRTKNKELEYEKEQRIANEKIYKLMLKQQSRLEEGRNQERKRISSDLHDGVLGRLYGTRLSLEFLNIKMSSEESKKFNSLTTELQQIEKEVREISHDLVSENFFLNSGIVKIIGDLLDEKNDLGATVFHLHHDQSIRWEEINEEVKLDIYRIIQEATQNIIKHSDAEEAWVKLGDEESKIVLTIKDNGRGFAQDERRKGIGLKSTESRVERWNGYFFITSFPGKGTEITIEIPKRSI